MAITPIGFAQADDPSDRIVDASTPRADTNQNAIVDDAISDDPTLTMVSPLIIDLNRGPVEQPQGNLEGQTALTSIARALRWIPAKAHHHELSQ